MAGTVGAIFNSALQLGSAVGIAIITSIQTSVQDKDAPDGALKYKGRAAAFWFLLAVVCVELIALVVFYDPKIGELGEEERGEKGKEIANEVTHEPDQASEKPVADDGIAKV